MSSKREEERNEKVIRGLLKLPPNRRCINCNGLGPQYVCTNFWTFVCTTCSGIHREFTHRVKSVSMAKFTAQEVEALQNGGNQRARELFLKDWDLQNTKLPDSSYPDRIREFIKNVYVEKKYATGKSSDKPPKDPQENKIHEEHRRASSYHSFSQSPPYDNQYEDRLYGKQRIMLTRKPGSDHGHYEGNSSSILYSPGRGREHTFEEPFANESSSSRTDFSALSTGEVLPHRSVSLGSFGSFDGTSSCPKSANAALSGVAIQPNKATMVASEPSISQHAVMIDLFNPQFSHHQDAKKSVDLFSDFINQPSCTSPTENKPLPALSSENTGWALFDTFHQVQPNADAKNYDSSRAAQCLEEPKEIFNAFSPKHDSSKYTLESVGHGEVPRKTDLWHANFIEAQNASNYRSTPVWNAFGDKNSQATFVNSLHETSGYVNGSSMPASQYSDLTLPKKQASNEKGIQIPIALDKDHKQIKNLSEKMVSGSLTSEVSCTQDWKSINPFDSTYDVDGGGDSMFFSMSSLQDSLPNSQLTNSCMDSLSQPWFQQSSASTFGPSIPQVGLPYVGGQVSSPQLQNVTSQGSGNPFA